MKRLPSLLLLVVVFLLFSFVNCSGSSVRRTIVRTAWTHIGDHFQGSTSGLVSDVVNYTAWVSYYDTDEDTPCHGVDNRRGYKESCLRHFHFDCSGLLAYCMRKAGIYIGRKSANDYFHIYSEHVDINDLYPGDLCFRGNTTRPVVSHSGIYVGNGNVISGFSKGMGVTVLPLSLWMSPSLSGNFAGCRRIKTEYWPNSDRSWDDGYTYSPPTVEVVCDGLNVREGIGADQPLLGRLHRGEQYIAAHHYDGWWKFYHDDQHAWAWDNCLRSISRVPYCIVQEGQYAYGGIFYAGPKVFNEDMSDAGYTHYNERFVLSASVNADPDYYQLYYQGKKVWIEKQYCRIYGL